MHNANAGDEWQQFLQKLATGNSYIIINLMPNVEVFFRCDWKRFDIYGSFVVI